MSNLDSRSTGEERTNPLSALFTYGGDDFQKEAVIRVVGVGGGGGNALNNMARQGLQGIEYIAINTDAQDLIANPSQIKIQAGRTLTKGLGAGARPDVGMKAVEECSSEVEQALKGSDMIFITAGMGGGTGTGGAPVVAQLARKMDILTVAIVTKPFAFEGRKRMQYAMQGIEALRQFVDALIIIPNDRVVDVVETNTPVEIALAKVDEVLYNSTRGISDLITTHGLINLDFADVKTIMKEGGNALIGSAVASGENRAEKAANAAIRSPLLDGMSIRGARSVLVNITANRSLTIREATIATEIIKREVGEDIGEDEIIFGMVVSEEMGDDLRVTVVATRFDEAVLRGEHPQDEQVVVLPRTGDGLQAKPTATVAPPPPTEVPRPAPPVQQPPIAPPPTARPMGAPAYKGEGALKDLDVPAYLRRLGTNPADQDLGYSNRITEQNPSPEPPATRASGTILRLRANERPEPKPRRDEEPPAFLRNMID